MNEVKMNRKNVYTQESFRIGHKDKINKKFNSNQASECYV